MKKRLLAVLLTLVIMVPVLSGAAFAEGFDNFSYDGTYKDGQFTDVSATSWYNSSVKAVYETGLMKGMTETAFMPDGNLTLAESIAMAARLHSIYHTGTETFEQGSPWYRVYVDYALETGIIVSEYNDYTKAATRVEFAVILSNALPGSGYAVINEIAEDAIPDVPAADTYAPEIYRLYRAGILTGNDAYGTFTPNANIARREAAAILSRMADTSLRKEIKLEAAPSGGETPATGEFDAAALVKGNIDSIYLGKWDQAYLDMVINTEAEIKQDYEDGIAFEVEYFCYYFEIYEEYLTDAQYNEIADMYKKIYSYTKFEVGAVVKSGDTYLVSVTIYPIDIMAQIMEKDADKFNEDWASREASGEFDKMSDAEFEAIWIREIIDLVKARMNNIGNLAPETISVQVVIEQDAEGEYYIISDNDFERIDALIIEY